jgi:hypothetical protein
MAERKRSALLPDLPTIDEQGLKGFEVGNWAGLLAPAGLDPAIVKKLHGEIMSILATADVKDRIKTLGYDEIGSTPEDFAAQVKNDVERWSEVVKRAQCPDELSAPPGDLGPTQAWCAPRCISIHRWSGCSPRASTRSTFCQAERNSSADDCRVTPAMCGVRSSRRAPSPPSVSSGLSAAGGSVE